MTEVMLDLETLGVTPDSCILTIAAIKWDRKSPMKSKESCDIFYRKINIDTCVSLGMKIDEKTLDWWSKQPDESYNEAFDKNDRVCITDALLDFFDWYGFSKNIWSNGDDFDCVIINEYARKLGVKTPWKYWETRDVRTLLDLGGVKYKGVLHNAVDDCYSQIIACKKALYKINN
jgi:exodeoxyribonuclease VIII